MAFWALFALTGATAALLAVPVAPSLFELRKRTDATSLPTSRHDARITNFAQAFSSRLETLRPDLERCAGQGEILRTRMDDTDVLLIGLPNFDLEAKLTNAVDILMCSDSVNILPGQVVEADLYADGVLRLQAGAALRAGMSAADIILEPETTVLRWLHSRTSVTLHRRSAAYGRLSAEHFIHLHPGCVFQHMHAPQIHTVADDEASAPHDSGCSCLFRHSRCHICDIESSHERETADSQDMFAVHRRRIRHEGDFQLPPHQTLNANLVSTGAVRFGFNSRFMGNTKSYKDTIIDEGACIHGSLVCGGTLYLGERSSVTGPIMSEEDVVIAPGARVGHPDALTTIAARRVTLASGCQLHGTVWARLRGIVEDGTGANAIVHPATTSKANGSVPGILDRSRTDA